MRTEKTEIVCLTRQKIPTEVEVRIGTDAITASNVIIHLRLCVDCKLTL